MELPRVKIRFLNGQLSIVGESADGLMGLIIGVSQNSGLRGKAKTITSLSDLKNELHLTEADDDALFEQVDLFYKEAEPGTKLVIYGVDPDKSATDICDPDEETQSLLHLAHLTNGKLRGVGIAFVNQAIVDEGDYDIADDVVSALPAAQTTAEKITNELYAPLFVVIDGYLFYRPNNLFPLTDKDYNRVSVLIGASQEYTPTSQSIMGTLLGRISKIPVQRNIGRVKDGPLNIDQITLYVYELEEKPTWVSEIYEKGYIVPRKYIGRSGFYFADDWMACDASDDYAHLTARRVIDKAYRIVYDTLLEQLLDELELNSDGTLQHAVVKSWQQMVENAINRSMTVNGELSSDEDGSGCVCYINPAQDVVATSKIEVSVKVRPHGYARYIDVNLGFDVENV